MLGNGLVHGMYNPATVWASDTSVYFDGVNDYALFTPNRANSATNALVDDMRISLWVKIRSIDADQTMLFIKDVDEDAYLKLWYDYSEEQLVVTRTDRDANNPVDLRHDYVVENMDTRVTNIQIKIKSDSMSISTAAVGISPSATVSAGSGEWYADNVITFCLGRNAPTGSELLDGWISNLAIWSQADLWGTVNNADVFNSGEPKNELETANAALYLYYTASETTFNPVGQIVTYTQANFSGGAYPHPTVQLHGATLTAHGQTS